jgi:cellulose synthase/poly-beta-1,6-N-acetylglucosamine synthase-like glycosyltransferase
VAVCLQVKLRYHIRVMIPCYKEDIDIVKKTIEAAAAATLPADCGRTIYLCDDGKDPEKRKFMASRGRDFVYGAQHGFVPCPLCGETLRLQNNVIFSLIQFEYSSGLYHNLYRNHTVQLRM